MDPNLLNQLLALLSQRNPTGGPLTVNANGPGGWMASLVSALGGTPGTTGTPAPTTPTPAPTPTPTYSTTKPSVGPGQRQALLNSGYDVNGRWISSAPNPNPWPAATTDPYSPSGGQSWNDYYQQQMQSLPMPTDMNYVQSTNPYGSNISPHQMYSGLGMAAPYQPVDTNSWAGTPGTSKWSLGPGYANYNDVLQRYSGYVPPTPTGKLSVRPMNPPFIRDPYQGSY